VAGDTSGGGGEVLKTREHRGLRTIESEGEEGVRRREEEEEDEEEDPER